MTPIDENERQAALDLTHSIIVQAPAGSGKTELLCQRFLLALTTVTQPEQVLAITFTRKAAEEMRDRIMRYLHHEEHVLGQKALQHALKHQWQLLAHPERLSIMTIDSLCMRIMEQAPLNLALHGYQITDDPIALYRQAVDLFFADVDEAHPWQQAFHALLLHCHNRWQNLHDLCVTMLAQREQWVMLLPELNQPQHWRRRLESNLTDCLQDAITTLDEQLSISSKKKLLSLLHFAGKHVAAFEPWLKHTTWPEATVATEACWRSLTNFLLTQDQQFRKTVDKRSGFPVGEREDKEYYKTAKQNMLDCLLELSSDPALLAALQMMQQAPPGQYSQEQWQQVLCIVQVLRALLAYFQLTMQRNKQTDFTEMALRASAALGHEEMPSELALTLDYRLQHILVDEFQDTSLLQFRLLERLTQSWQTGDGHSLFVVGDPLQSIYRFRQAEVGLFLRVWQYGFPHLPLKPIQLKQNFRAQEKLVHFYNNALAQVLPSASAMYDGAVAYSAVAAVNPPLPNEAVVTTLCTDNDSHYLKPLLQHIQILQKNNPDLTIGVLVRSRSHLTEIMPALRARQIHFQAHDLSKLNKQAVVIDLLSWLKALLNLDDRLSWLAMLRQPCLGLSLQTIQLLFAKEDKLVWQRLLNDSLPEALEPEQKKILQTVMQAWQQARSQLQRSPLDQILWSLWHHLQADQYWSDAGAVQASAQFFRLLSQFQQAGDLSDLPAFEHYLSQCAFSVQQQETPITLMTVHKAKGLEFDVVLLPELNRITHRGTMPLLLFDEVILPSGPKFLVAPLQKQTKAKDPIFNFLWSIEKSKAHHEQLRLLYVACTRAKQHIYFYAQLPEAIKDQLQKPTAGSFLADLWPII